MNRSGGAVAPSVVTVGTFDGIHRGHRFVVDRLVAAARERGLRSVVVTFDQHPLRVVNAAAAPALLSTHDEKLEALAATGLEHIAIVPFTRELAAYEADQFVDHVLIGRFGMRELFIGHDHGFGRGRTGDAAILERLGASRGFGVHVVPPVDGRDGRPVSSSAIRSAVATGDLEAAADGLARPYWVTGTVEPGEARGAALGYRTINLSSPPAEKLLPPDGVYAVRVETPRGRFPGMLNLGGRPTFADNRRVIEAHLFDAAGDWYGMRVRVDFLARIRGVQRFAGPAELSQQLGRDAAASRLIVARAATGI